MKNVPKVFEIDSRVSKASKGTRFCLNCQTIQRIVVFQSQQLVKQSRKVMKTFFRDAKFRVDVDFVFRNIWNDLVFAFWSKKLHFVVILTPLERHFTEKFSDQFPLGLAGCISLQTFYTTKKKPKPVSKFRTMMPQISDVSLEHKLLDTIFAGHEPRIRATLTNLDQWWRCFDQSTQFSSDLVMKKFYIRRATITSFSASFNLGGQNIWGSACSRNSWTWLSWRSSTLRDLKVVRGYVS